MFRVDNDSAVAIMPAATSAGTPGYFTDGNPATGQPATVLAAEFMNMVMMELANLVTDSGQTLTKNDYKQVSKAVQAMIANLSTVTWDKVTNKPTDWAVAGKTTLTGAVTLASTLTVAGVSTLNSTLTVAGATTLKTTLGVTGAATLSSTLSVAGATTFAANVTVSGTCFMASGNVGSSVEIGSVTKVNTPYLDFHSSGQNIDYDSRIIATDGDGTVGGGTLKLQAATLSLQGDTTVSGQLAVTGMATFSGAVRPASYIDLGYQATTAGSRNIAFYSGANTTLTGSITVTGTTLAAGVMTLNSGTVAIVGAATVSGTLTVTGNVNLAGGIITTASNVIRMVTSGYGVVMRAESSQFYLLTTANGDAYGDWTSARPFRIDLATSNVFMGAGLSVGGAASAGTLTVSGTATLSGATTVSSTFAVTGATTLSNTLSVTGAVTLASSLKAAGELQSTTANGLRLVNGDYGVMARNYGGAFYLLATDSGDQYGSYSTLRPFMINLRTGAVSIANGLSATGGATIDTLTATGAAALSSTLDVTGATTLSSTLAVTGAVMLSSSLTVATTAIVNGATGLKSTLSVTGATTLSSTLGVTGAVTLSSSLTVATTAIVTGATTLKSTLAVTGTATFSGSISVAATATIATLVVNGNESVGGSLGVTGAITSGSTIQAAGGVYTGNGAAYLQTDGNVYGGVWGGYLSTYISNAVSATAVGAATAALAAGAVGTYGFMWVAATLGPGDLVAASALYWGSYNYKSSAQPAGTWMCCGYVVPGDKATVFKRVA
ncbi:beta strand repeat-containing protein [Pseudomonas sp. NY11226]|uniref:beta strand repeat-containing protein n=1 Tax=Pseudomonas sp. NY11226 TaxID=3400362 RepID=UPI003A8B3648